MTVVWDKDALLKTLANRVTPTAPSTGLNNTLPTQNLDIAGNEEADAQRKAYFMARLGTINGYDQGPRFGASPYLEQAEDLMFRANQFNQKAAELRANRPVEFVGRPGPVKLNGGAASVAKLGNGRFGDFVRAISGKESGGNYGAVNPHSGAMGKYQIMPSNISGPGGWDKEALGKDITTQQFLGSPKLQEKIARYKLKQYYKKYGVKGAASAWYSGDPNKWQNTSPQGGYPSIHAYVMDILNRMGLG